MQYAHYIQVLLLSEELNKSINLNKNITVANQYDHLGQVFAYFSTKTLQKHTKQGLELQDVLPMILNDARSFC